MTPETLEALHTALGDRKAPVALTAIRFIRKIKRKESIAPLIDHLGELEEGVRLPRLYCDIVDVLKSITGADLKTANDWRNWQKGTQKGVKKKRTKRKVRKGRRTAVAKNSEFFSIPLASDRVLFLIDVSQSMLERDPEGLPPTRPPVKRTGAPQKLESEPPADRERLSRVQKALISAIRALPETTRFGIISFDHEPTRWGGKSALVKAEKATKAAARKLVAGLKAQGDTRTGRAPAAALDSANGD